MDAQAWYRLAADGVLVSHVAIVVFVILGLLFTLVGGALRWGWVKNKWFRLTHLGAIVVIVGQAWFGAVCPWTTWENRLRELGGQQTYGDFSFVGYWLHRFLYYQAPGWVFVVCYTAFGLLVLLSWWWVPVRWRKGAKP